MKMISADKKFSQDEIKVAKDNFDCVEYVKQKTTKYTKYGNKILANCLFHDDQNPSMIVWRTGFKCQACDAKGDAITLVASYRAGGFLADVKGSYFKEACEEIGAEEDVEIPVVRDTQDDEKAYVAGYIYMIALQNRLEADQYLASRGIVADAVNYGCLTPESTTQYHEKYPFLKHYRWLCFPMHSVSDNIVSKCISGLNLRNIDSDDKEIKHRKIGCNGVFQKLKKLDDEFVPINQTIGCESATDCLSIKAPATAIFGVNNASQYRFKGTAFDRDAVGIKATNLSSLVLYDGADLAESKDSMHIELDLESLEEKCAALLLFSNDIKLIDQLLKPAYAASHYSIEIKSVFIVIDSMQKRTIRNFFKQMLRGYDFNFNKTDDEKKELQLKKLYHLYENLKKIYDEIVIKNNATSGTSEPYLKELIINLRLVLPQRMMGRISDREWRSFDKGLTRSESVLDLEDLKQLKYYSMEGFPPIVRMGGLTTLAGHSNIGKTHLAIYMIASITDKNPNAKVVFYSLETNEHLIRQCLEEYELCDQERVKVIDKLINIAYLPQLMKIDIDQGYTHFFIDNAKILYQEDSAAMDRAVRDLELISGTTCISVVLLAQLLKSVDSSSYYYVRRHEIHGGGSLYDRSDTVITIQEYQPNVSKQDLKSKDHKDFLMRHISFPKIRAFIDTTKPKPILEFKKLSPEKAKVVVSQITKNS